MPLVINVRLKQTSIYIDYSACSQLMLLPSGECRVLPSTCCHHATTFCTKFPFWLFAGWLHRLCRPASVGNLGGSGVSRLSADPGHDGGEQAATQTAHGRGISTGDHHVHPHPHPTQRLSTARRLHFVGVQDGHEYVRFVLDD